MQTILQRLLVVLLLTVLGVAPGWAEVNPHPLEALHGNLYRVTDNLSDWEAVATIEILHAEEIGSTDGGSYVLLTIFTAEGTYRAFFGEVISSGVFRVPAVQLREALEPFAFLHRGASELDFTTSCLLNPGRRRMRAEEGCQAFRRGGISQRGQRYKISSSSRGCQMSMGAKSAI